MADPDDSPTDVLVQAGRAYADGLLAIRATRIAEQKHTDDTLVWSLGLMGAGLFALAGLFKAACGLERYAALPWVGAPWALGIALAVIGRLLAERARREEYLAFLDRWQGVESALALRGTLDFAAMKTQILASIQESRPSLKKRLKKAKRWAQCTDAVSISIHVAFLVGMAFVLVALARCPR